MRALTTGNAAHALANRANDLYQSPPEAVKALLKAEVVPVRVWEPACGPGSIVRVLRAEGHDVLATDLVDYDSEEQDASGVDFLIPGIAESYFDADRAIITNPPFKNAQAFVERALSFSPYVAMLLRLAFIESERRSNILDNGRLSRVLVFSNRLPMMHREGWDKTTNSSAMAFAWFVWDRTHRGPTELRRIAWSRA